MPIAGEDLLRGGFITYELQAASCNFKKINLRVASSFLRVTSCFLRVTSCKFKEIILRVVSCALWVEN